ncbi:condensation domain-containing protein, partial [Ascidiimonas sp. W6]|uniref:condensation domain-containing protein n=1 Tax=Ascidiimonas meishanensis TaxID=3128903 RepID=UPI0030EB871C
MSIQVLNILKEAKTKKVKIIVNDGSLTVKSIAPIDFSLLQRIKNNKIIIIKYIEEYQVRNKKNILTKITSYNNKYIINIPLSFSQERLWFLDQLEGSLAYHIPLVIRLQGKLNIPALEKALKGIISRHEILRTLIESENGVGYQKVVSADNWGMEHLMVSNDDSLDFLIASFLETPFDLAKEYKFRSALYHIEEGNYVLAMV